MGTVRDKYELLEHPPYSPDLVPSEFHLFLNIRKFVAGKRFTSNEEATVAYMDISQPFRIVGFK